MKKYIGERKRENVEGKTISMLMYTFEYISAVDERRKNFSRSKKENIYKIIVDRNTINRFLLHDVSDAHLRSLLRHRIHSLLFAFISLTRICPLTGFRTRRSASHSCQSYSNANNIGNSISITTRHRTKQQQQPTILFD